jgi:hypothetical protein
MRSRAAQRAHCASRIPDPVARARFVNMQVRADELIIEAAELRRESWANYRRLAAEAAQNAIAVPVCDYREDDGADDDEESQYT